MTTQLGAGKEILAYCGKCKLNLAHIIVAMNSPTAIGQCQCKTCKAVHAYRSNEPKPVRRKAVALAKPAAHKSWHEAIESAKGQARPYAMATAFKKGDLIAHPVFGKGVVESVLENNKIETHFEQGFKTLIHQS
ncbi:hypothetical protein K1X76_12765 [bacterium]|nr:hypothetical protein [bacterium]